MALIVSVSGVRGIVGSELTAEVARNFAMAFGEPHRGQAIAIGRDSRPSGAELAAAVASGLGQLECPVTDCGILPTPSFGYLVRERGFAAGVQITASHNPAPYNGLKLFGPDGAVLPAEQGREVEERYRRFRPPPGITGTVTATVMTESWRSHCERALSLIDVGPIAAKRFKVVLDANGGAGGPAGLWLLQQFGCEVTPVGCEPDGLFTHDPEPLPKHLRGVEERVRRVAGAIGAVLDPDADRLVLIDETGTCLSEELTLALAVRERLIEDRGPVVINLSTSRATEDVAREAGVPCHRAAVGEANVVAKMRAVGALIGGEGNGGVIDPRVGWVRDPFVGIGLALQAMSRTGQSLQELAGSLPKYVIQKDKHDLAREKLPAVFEALVRAWPEATSDRADGLWLGWPDRWLHVRASNTEPIVRVIAEARTAALAGELCERAAKIIHSA